MAFFSKYKLLLLSIALIVIIFVAYALLKPSKPSNNAQNLQPITVEQVNSSATDPNDPGADFVLQLLAIQNINFNTEFFRDPVYRELKDQYRPIEPRPIGRPNPFAEIGNDDPLQPVGPTSGFTLTSTSTGPGPATTTPRTGGTNTNSNTRASSTVPRR